MTVTLAKTAMRTATGNDAIDTVMNLNENRCTIWEYTSSWSCEESRSIKYDHSTALVDVWWMVLLFRDQPERITFRFSTRRFGEFDQSQRSDLYIETGTLGEPGTTHFTFTPNAR